MKYCLVLELESSVSYSV